MVTEDDVRYCLQKAKEIADDFRNFYPDHPEILTYYPRSVENLRPALEKKYGYTFKVQFPRTKAPHHVVLGYYVRVDREKTVYIFVDYDENYCWRRLIECKELFQFVIDRQQDRSTDYKKQLQALNPQFPTKAEYVGSVASEDMAEIAAMEFLFPYAEREKCRTAQLGYMEIAMKYKVPQALVSEYLSTSYMAALGSLTL